MYYIIPLCFYSYGMFTALAIVDRELLLTLGACASEGYSIVGLCVCVCVCVSVRTKSEPTRTESNQVLYVRVFHNECKV